MRGKQPAGHCELNVPRDVGQGGGDGRPRQAHRWAPEAPSSPTAPQGLPPLATSSKSGLAGDQEKGKKGGPSGPLLMGRVKAGRER